MDPSARCANCRHSAGGHGWPSGACRICGACPGFAVPRLPGLLRAALASFRIWAREG